MIIYKIVNKINGKIYIGQTTRTLHQRRLGHLNSARKGVNTQLYNAIRKYGEHNFAFSEICSARTKGELNRLETYYIKKFDTINNGYNMVDGGYNNIMFNNEVKNKHKKKMQTEEVRKKISDSMKNYRKTHQFSESHRRALSKAMRGNHNFGSGDTRSIGCYCIDENGDKKYFHSYRDAWKWWVTINNPFDCGTECIYQRKIKQSIEKGYFIYKKKRYEFPKWFKGGGSDEKVGN